VLPPATATGEGCPFTYVVQPGDRLFRIAYDLGYDPNFWVEIAAANNIPDPYLVYPGQELTIPCE
jgi:nucleoid-associated protein YgaU